jgi:hypothetical protein
MLLEANSCTNSCPFLFLICFFFLDDISVLICIGYCFCNLSIGCLSVREQKFDSFIFFKNMIPIVFFQKKMISFYIYINLFKFFQLKYIILNIILTATNLCVMQIRISV